MQLMNSLRRWVGVILVTLKRLVVWLSVWLGVLVRFVFWQIMSGSSFFVCLAFLLGFWGVDELGYSFCALWAVYVVVLLVLRPAGKFGALFRYYTTAWTYPRWRLALVLFVFVLHLTSRCYDVMTSCCIKHLGLRRHNVFLEGSGKDQAHEEKNHHIRRCHCLGPTHEIPSRNTRQNPRRRNFGRNRKSNPTSHQEKIMPSNISKHQHKLLVYILYICLITLITLLSVFSAKYSKCPPLMPKKYKNVSLPQELYDKLEMLAESKEAGYVSVSDAVKDAVRELLRKHKLLP